MARNIAVAMSCVAMLMLWLLLPGPVLAQDATAELEAWSIDPLVKVFRDDPPTDDGEAVADVARGEHATLRVVVRSEKPLKTVAVAGEAAGVETEQNIAHFQLRLDRARPARTGPRRATG